MASDNEGRLSGFVPGQHGIDAYGKGGFRFAGMSHRGSILAMPTGIQAWPVTDIRQLTLENLAPALAAEAGVEFLIVGTGIDLFILPEAIRARFREAAISIDQMQTGPAARTYNIMVAERRRAAAALIAVA